MKRRRPSRNTVSQIDRRTKRVGEKENFMCCCALYFDRSIFDFGFSIFASNIYIFLFFFFFTFKQDVSSRECSSPLFADGWLTWCNAYQLDCDPCNLFFQPSMHTAPLTLDNKKVGLKFHNLYSSTFFVVIVSMFEIWKSTMWVGFIGIVLAMASVPAPLFYFFFFFYFSLILNIFGELIMIIRYPNRWAKGCS